MKFSYRLARMCGAIHENGNVLFGHANELGQTMEGSEEGVNDVLFSAVGNRINVFELAKHASYTMPIEARSDIARMAINHKSTLLIAIDVEGRAMVIGTHRRVVVHRFNFKGRVRYCSFSPNDKLFAVSVGRKIQIWLAPAAHKQVAPFTLHRTITGHVDDITCFDWSADSRYLCSGSKDHTVRVWEATRSDDFIPFTLSAHKSKIVNCFFAEGGSKLYTIADDCALFVWSWVEEEGTTADAADTSLGFFIDKALKKTLTLHPKLGQWKLDKKHFLWMKPSEEEKKAGRKKKKQSRAIASLAGEDNLEYDDGEGHQLTVKCCALHDSLLAVGLSNGSFRLFEMPMLTPLHTLSISKAQVESVSINQSGEWLAFGSPQLGQLLVWEWQSESYVLKQQGHAYDMKAVAFAPDGTIMATGGDDAKVKLWSASSGFCFVTFTQHTAPVTAVEFGPAKGRVLLSASLDGTIRAYDLLRYRNFRTMSAPDPVQFISLAVDPSGEVVCAGSLDPFNVYVFALQTGNLLDILSGHEGPVSCLQFDQASGHMASGSWDKTVKVWDVYRNEALETFHLPADVLCLAYRPDGKQMCVGTLQGQLHLWNVEDAVEEAVIDGQRDIAGGRGAEDKITAQASAMRRHFSTVTFSADGTCVLAGGRSKFVCIYETSQQVLLKKFQVSHNRSRDGVLDLLPSSMMSEAGPYASLNLDQGSDGEGGASTLLPGATRGADGKRGLTRKEVSVACVRFSATGREWAAATTDGLLVYALNEDLLFDPIDVDETLTPQAVSECLERGECSRALRMSLHLNDSSLIIRSMEAVDAGDIPLVLQSLSLTSHTSVGILCRLIHALAERIVHSRHLEFYLSWSLEILRIHSHTLKTDRPHIAAGGKGGVLSLSMSARLRSSLRELQRAVMRQQHILLTLCDDNQYTLSFLSSVQTVEPEEEQQTVQQQLDEKGSDRPSKEEPAGTEEDQVVAPADQEPKHIEEGTEHQEQSPVVSSKKRKPSSGKQQSQPGAAEKEDRSPQAKKMRKRRQKTPKTKGA